MWQKFKSACWATRYLIAINVLFKVIYFGVIYIWAHDRSFVVDDSGRYLALAHSINDNLMFALPGKSGELIPETLRTPVYPVFLAIFTAFGMSNACIAMVQALLQCLLVPLFYMIGEALSNKRVVGLSCAMLCTTDALLLEYSHLIVTEFCAVLLWVLSIAFNVCSKPSKKSSLLSGILGGLSILTRPSFVAVVMPSFLLWGRQQNFKLKFRILALIAAFATMSAWSARNYAHYGVWETSSLKGYSTYLLWYGKIQKMQIEGKSWNDFYLSPENQAIMDRIYSGKDGLALSEELHKIGIQSVIDHPVLFLKYVWLESSFRLMSNIDTEFDNMIRTRQAIFNYETPSRSQDIAMKVNLFIRHLSYAFIIFGVSVYFLSSEWFKQGMMAKIVKLLLVSYLPRCAASHSRAAVYPTLAIIGIFMAMEAIKILRKKGIAFRCRHTRDHPWHAGPFQLQHLQ